MTTLRTSAAGRKAIAQHEGTRLTAYLDSVGVLTIGVGHTSAAGPPIVKKGMKITAAECDEILARDLAAVETDVNRLVKVPISQNQFDALVSLVFNIGGTAFRKSSLLKKLNAGDVSGAGAQFLVWNKGTVNGKKVKIQGLTTRRQAERALFLSGGAKAAPAPAVPEPAASTAKTVTVEIVQRKLYDLGYTEVGSRKPDGSFDGKLGGMTQAAILIFRADNGLPSVGTIDQDLLTALDTAPKRKLARNDATAGEVRQSVPEVKSNWRIKIGAIVAGGFSAAGALFDGIVSNLGTARGYLSDMSEYVGDVPGWVKFGMLVALAGGAYYIAQRGERKGVEAFQVGARR
ncbi:glycoside hydrolase family protein [Neorhizobium sp. AL 9.2.2]|uniref:glycoside hydrolase family protein n=1 Tax=Neorhizobium sp. AL 9.2.2 TaxID=2712894 RepID=UPI00157430BF|nr:glycoside hydrolase family protein [Neorhizobium sp. AL 9.2.2]NSY17278.1 glycoside hydrolase family protein [Neorhizobium sp. AL 9.2.2]